MPFIFVRPLYKDVTILSNSYMTEGMQTLLHIHSHQIWTYIYNYKVKMVGAYNISRTIHLIRI